MKPVNIGWLENGYYGFIIKKNIVKKLVFGLLVLGAFFLSSCYHDGYGCRGTSKLITRVK
jgi:hypothetical protein